MGTISLIELIDLRVAEAADKRFDTLEARLKSIEDWLTITNPLNTTTPPKVPVPIRIKKVGGKRDGSKLQEAIDWLKDTLDDGAVRTETIERMRSRAGIITLATLIKAKSRVVKAFREEGVWYWSLK